MNEKEARDIVERLRAAAQAKSGVVELQGADARDFVFVADRETVLGSFEAKGGDGTPPFFVSVVSTSHPGAYQWFVMERRKGSPLLGTSKVTSDAIVWRYKPAKQTGDNAKRLAEFVRLAGSHTLQIPLPDVNIAPFAAAVLRAIELRLKADAAGGNDGASTDGDDGDMLDELRRWHSDPARLRAITNVTVASIRTAHATNPKSWCLTRRADRGVYRLNVGIARVLDIAPDYLGLAVNLDVVPDPERAALRKRVDFSARQKLNDHTFGENGLLVIDDLNGELDPVIWRAHEEIVRRAAHAASPFARFHNAEILEALEEITGEELPSPELSGGNVSYWKLAPGEKGSEWAQCRDGRYIAIGWKELGDLSGVDETEFDRRAAEAREKLGWGAGVDQVWKFRNLAVGDRIVANAGTTRVLGIGTVTGAYYFVPTEPNAHRVPVEWDDTSERRVDMPGWRKTIIRLTEDTFQRVSSAPATSTPALPVQAPKAVPTGGIDFDGVIAHLESQSLSFPPELVASYLLALQAKRFVLLTGISGTGKTQLALEVARLFAPQHGAASTPAEDDEDVVITVKPYMVNHGRFVVPTKLARELNALLDPDAKRIDVEVPGGPRVSSAVYKDRERPGLFYVLPSGALKKWFQEQLAPDDRLRLRRAVAADGAERIVIERAIQEVARRPPPSHELIAVRPDWTDSRALLGFYNPLTREYTTTPTLRLILRAADEVRRAAAEQRAPRPYFLIFDEMNLARVEHYFSDFLSAMESREEIHLHDDAEVAEADDGAVPRRITLPANLFVIGTVNVDETTYMFSPKVLDRAFVLEFNEVDLDALSGRAESEDPASTPLALVHMTDGLQLLGRYTDAEWKRFDDLASRSVRSTLDAVQRALQSHNRHFGYRVAREIARFVVLSVDQTHGGDAAANAALDVAVFAKVLPKLHGTQSELEPVLTDLFAVAAGGTDDRIRPERWQLTDGTLVLSAGGEGPRLPRSALKLWRMWRRVRAHGFVSFIE